MDNKHHRGPRRDVPSIHASRQVSESYRTHIQEDFDLASQTIRLSKKCDEQRQLGKADTPGGVKDSIFDSETVFTR